MFTGRFLLRSISSRTMTTTSSPRAKDLSALRPSASLVVVNSSNEVLLVHRNPNATSFADMHVRTAYIANSNLSTKPRLADSLLAPRRSFREEITTRDRMNHFR